MAKSVIQIKCPCCHKRIEVDTRNGKARAMRTKDDGLDKLLNEHKSEPDRLADAFERAQDKQRHQTDQFEDLFNEAKEKAKDDDSKPRNPFDLE